MTLAVDALAQDIELLEGSIRTLREQLLLTQRHADRIRALADKGTISLDELQRRDLAVLGQSLALQNAERDKESKRSQLAAARIAVEQLPTIVNERLRGLREALANVQQRSIELETRRAVIVRAPVSGRVEAVPALAGATVDSNSLIATIVPETSELRARLFLPTRAIGKVHIGQAVLIRYEAFPYQKYGAFHGRIEEVSTSVLLPQEIIKIAPVKLDEPAYVVDVAIQRQRVALGREQLATLRPDMLLTATIEIDRRPLLAWIGESVLGVAQN